MGGLTGRRVVVTRAARNDDPLVSALSSLGAVPLVRPLIAIEPTDDPAGLEAAARAAASGRYGAVLFTSANGVAGFLDAGARAGLGGDRVGGAIVGAVGPATARALERAGVAPTLIAAEHHGEGLADALLAALGGARPHVLVPRAKVGAEALPERLKTAGLAVDVVTAYVTTDAPPAHLEELVRELELGVIDAITFASGSAATRLVEGLAHAVGRERARAALARCALASIGPTTSATLRGLGLEPTVSAAPHTLDGLVAALAAHFGDAPID